MNTVFLYVHVHIHPYIFFNCQQNTKKVSTFMLNNLHEWKWYMSKRRQFETGLCMYVHWITDRIIRQKEFIQNRCKCIYCYISHLYGTVPMVGTYYILTKCVYESRSECNFPRLFNYYLISSIEISYAIKACRVFAAEK